MKVYAVIGVVVGAILMAPRLAEAGFLVGSGTGNDDKAEVLTIVNNYNATNDPDLPTDFDLFKKTDDDSAFVFDMSNGFMFFSDSAGTVPVTTEGALQSLSTAYFKYTGPEDLLYYSLKAGSNVSVYAFMSGLNLMHVSSQEISHASFWGGPGSVPEPSTWLTLMVGMAVFGWWRHCRPTRRVASGRLRIIP